jgi:hypothetical protein
MLQFIDQHFEGLGVQINTENQARQEQSPLHNCSQGRQIVVFKQTCDEFHAAQHCGVGGWSSKCYLFGISSIVVRRNDIFYQINNYDHFVPDNLDWLNSLFKSPLC